MDRSLGSDLRVDQSEGNSPWVDRSSVCGGVVGRRRFSARSVVVGVDLGLWMSEWTSVCGCRVAAFGSCSPFLSLSLSLLVRNSFEVKIEL